MITAPNQLRIPAFDRSALALPIPWQQGEHVAVIGDTGSGKTYLINKLIAQRQWVIFFRTKRDRTRLDGFKTIRRASGIDDGTHTRFVLDPAHSRQILEGYELIERVWKDGYWTLVIDEQWYLENRLKLTREIEQLLTQGRSMNISVVMGMQRPAFVSRFCISQCTHLFAFRMDGRDVKSVRDATTERIVPAISQLRGHKFAYYNRPARFVALGEANRLARLLRPPLPAVEVQK
jgi:AAA domain-containing protein